MVAIQGDICKNLCLAFGLRSRNSAADRQSCVEDAQCLVEAICAKRPCKRVEDPRRLVLMESNEKCLEEEL